jgi:pimeloyl-ACP methyl ester carboxylesterase
MTATDLVVVLPGILGSTLRHDGHLVWAPSAGSALRVIGTFGASIKQLQLPTDIGDGHPGDGVQPVALMPDLHVLPRIWTPVKGYDRLLSRLRSLGYRKLSGDPGAPPSNLIPFPYDWRLSCRYNGQRLAATIGPALERWRAQGGPYADARVVLVCHSMGGLIARWYIEKCGGAETTRKLITLGTPYRGAARSLDQLVNGSHKGLGPFGLNLTGFARSMPSLHQLLPEYACIVQGDDLVKTTDITLPELDAQKVSDAARFHAQLRDAEAQRPDSLRATHAILGIGQRTATTARLANGHIELADTYQGKELFGDATVPIVAACRADVSMDSNTLRRVPDKHGNLQRNSAALDEMEGILTASDIIVKAAKRVGLRVDVPEFALAGQDITIEVTPSEYLRHTLHVTVTNEGGTLVEARDLRTARGTITTTIDDLTPGAYTIEVTGTGPVSPYAPVSSSTLIWETPEPLAP